MAFSAETTFLGADAFFFAVTVSTEAASFPGAGLVVAFAASFVGTATFFTAGFAAVFCTAIAVSGCAGVVTDFTSAVFTAMVFLGVQF
jgi:hypothetical protein